MVTDRSLSKVRTRKFDPKPTFAPNPYTEGSTIVGPLRWAIGRSVHPRNQPRGNQPVAVCYVECATSIAMQV